MKLQVSTKKSISDFATGFHAAHYRPLPRLLQSTAAVGPQDSRVTLRASPTNVMYYAATNGWGADQILLDFMSIGRPDKRPKLMASPRDAEPRD